MVIWLNELTHLRGDMSKKAGRNSEVDAGAFDSSSDGKVAGTAPLNRVKCGRKIDGCCCGSCEG